MSSNPVLSTPTDSASALGAWACRQRMRVSWALGLAILGLLAFSGHSWSQDHWLDGVLEATGLICLILCTVGRIWASVHIDGRKDRELVTDGPYSVVRNPLYVFSAIGALGFGLASENLAVLALLLLAFALYYPLVVRGEEEVLAGLFPDSFPAYAARVRRFLPRPSLFRENAIVPVDARRFRRSLMDATVFLWLYLLLQGLEWLHGAGVLPTLFLVP